jgi:hypothetical protein
MERDLARVSEPWNAIRRDEIADDPGESRHAEDDNGEQGGAHGSILWDVTSTANTALYSSSKKLAPRGINDLGCAKN